MFWSQLKKRFFLFFTLILLIWIFHSCYWLPSSSVPWSCRCWRWKCWAVFKAWTGHSKVSSTIKESRRGIKNAPAIISIA